MDGKDRALDNIFVERLWRSVKYEVVYPSQWEAVQEARQGLHEYFEFLITSAYINRSIIRTLGLSTRGKKMINFIINRWGGYFLFFDDFGLDFGVHYTSVFVGSIASELTVLLNNLSIFPGSS